MDPEHRKPPRTTSPSSRDRLLDAASELFHTQGYSHVSLDQILSESGVCRSNFYYHFKGKEDLALMVIDRWVGELEAQVLAPLAADAGLSPLQKARGMVEATVDRLESQGCRVGCPFGTMANAESEHNERFRAKLVTVFQGFLSGLEALYTEAAALGELRADVPPPAALAATSLALIQGGLLLSKTFRDAAVMRSAVGAWFDLVTAPSSQPA